MLQVTKGLTTKLTIPVDYINIVDGEKTRGAFMWDAGDEIIVTLKHKKNVLGYEAATSDNGIEFKLNGDEDFNKYDVTIIFTRGGRSFYCYVGTLQIIDKATPDFNTLNGVYIYADDDTIKFIKAYDGERKASIAELNAARIQTQQNGGGGGSADLCVNITYAELKALRDSGKLVAGQSYRITDYTTTTTQEDTSAAGHDFDVIVTAIDAHTLSEDARAAKRDGDDYFNGCNPAAWRLRYSLDNNAARFGWAYADIAAQWYCVVDAMPWYYTRIPAKDEGALFAWAYTEDGIIDENDIMFTTTETPAAGDIATQDGTQYEIAEFFPQRAGDGKGVIYYLRDEFGNECPFDFKNIQFHTIDDQMFSVFNGGDINGSSHHNKIAPYYKEKAQLINKIVFTDEAVNCVIGLSCDDCMFYGKTHNVSVGSNCVGIHTENALYLREATINASDIYLTCAETTSGGNWLQNLVVNRSANGGEGNKEIQAPTAGATHITTIGSIADVKINV